MSTEQRKRKAADSTLTSLASAIHSAEQAANESMLPQTVFMDSQSHGWWHTWNGARRIERAAKLHVTVLPAKYFS